MNMPFFLNILLILLTRLIFSFQTMMEMRGKSLQSCLKETQPLTLLGLKMRVVVEVVAVGAINWLCQGQVDWADQPGTSPKIHQEMTGTAADAGRTPLKGKVMLLIYFRLLAPVTLLRIFYYPVLKSSRYCVTMLKCVGFLSLYSYLTRTNLRMYTFMYLMHDRVTGF